MIFNTTYLCIDNVPNDTNQTSQYSKSIQSVIVIYEILTEKYFREHRNNDDVDFWKILQTDL